MFSTYLKTSKSRELKLAKGAEIPFKKEKDVNFYLLQKIKRAATNSSRLSNNNVSGRRNFLLGFVPTIV